MLKLGDWNIPRTVGLLTASLSFESH
jgi:hypothetical protein